MQNLHEQAYQCLLTDSVEDKLLLAEKLYDDFRQGKLLAEDIELPEILQAGHPQNPRLVPPREVPKRKLGTDSGRAAAIHSFCHIEFNAINLACDAVYRFRGMPDEYYRDWCRVAAEEAYHFSLLNERLAELGHAYGDFPAHNGLWELAQKTSGDVLDRMALIPRVMEARGLDVTPLIQKKFLNVGDRGTADVLSIILRDEIGHVEAGSRWFRFVCEQRGLDAEQTYFSLLKKYMKGDIHCPMHFQARLDAGFSESELDQLQLLCNRR